MKKTIVILSKKTSHHTIDDLLFELRSSLSMNKDFKVYLKYVENVKVNSNVLTKLNPDILVFCDDIFPFTIKGPNRMTCSNVNDLLFSNVWEDPKMVLIRDSFTNPDQTKDQINKHLTEIKAYEIDRYIDSANTSVDDILHNIETLANEPRTPALVFAENEDHQELDTEDEDRLELDTEDICEDEVEVEVQEDKTPLEMYEEEIRESAYYILTALGFNDINGATSYATEAVKAILLDIPDGARFDDRTIYKKVAATLNERDPNKENKYFSKFIQLKILDEFNYAYSEGNRRYEFSYTDTKGKELFNGTIVNTRVTLLSHFVNAPLGWFELLIFIANEIKMGRTTLLLDALEQ